jgi:hypothetical protein
LGEKLQWLGGDDLWLEPQPWAIIGGAATPEQVTILISAIDRELRKPSPIGATLLNKPIKKSSEEPGMGTAGGIWPSINGTLIWALARVNGNMAWDEWRKNSLAAHAEAYPDVWYGIWSGPDTYNSHMSAYPGQTTFVPPENDSTSSWTGSIRLFWTDFPVMNQHSHAWPLFATTKLLGIAFTEHGVELAPVLPFEEYSFSSPLVGIEKTRDGYAGWYAPSVAGNWEFTLRLNDEEANSFQSVEINGAVGELNIEGSCLQFRGESTPEEPLRWKITA